jgi:hypothetical protein
VDTVTVTVIWLLLAVVVFAIFRMAYRRDRELRLREDAIVSSTTVPKANRSARAPIADLTSTVFLSYRREDSIDLSGRIYDKLSAELGRTTVFKDIDSIPLGVDFRQHIEESLENCRVFLLVMRNNWRGQSLSSKGYRIDDPRDFIRIEVETALRRRIPVIPVLVQGADIPSESELPDGMRGIAYRQAIRVRSDPDFHRDCDRIVTSLRSNLRMD